MIARAQIGPDVRGTFVPVGRIAVGPGRVERESGAVVFAVRIRDQQGGVELFTGRGPNLPAAVADALGSFGKLPFVVAEATVSAGSCGTGCVAAQVLVESAAAGAVRHAAGHAEAADEGTAVAVAAVRGLAAGGFLKTRFLPPGARDVELSTERIVRGIEPLLPAPPDPGTMGLVRELVARELNRFGTAQAIVVAHASDREDALTRFDAQEALTLAGGGTKTADTRTQAWWEWFPGLDNDRRTLREVLAELPAAPPTAIPWIVRLFENPQGWLRLHGAVHLKHHDMIHVLLGRGLLDQDEAFVIGFTMGSTKAVGWLERTWFKFVMSHLYPEPYRISWRTLSAYDLGLEAGREFGARNLHRRLREELLDQPLGDLRRDLEIDTRRLREFYARERAALPGTLASQRLP